MHRKTSRVIFHSLAPHLGLGPILSSLLTVYGTNIQLQSQRKFCNAIIKTNLMPLSSPEKINIPPNNINEM